MKKLSLWLLIITLSLALSGVYLLASCKTEETVSDSGQEVSEEAVQQDTEESVESVDKPTLIFWQNESGSGIAQWYRDVVAEINANEDFMVEIVENPIEDVIDKLTAAGVAQDGFDITWDWSGSYSTLMRGTGGMYQPINNLVSEEALSKLSEGTITANTDESGNTYGVPFFLETVYMAYNLEILENAGVDTSSMPEEWDDFIDVCEKVKESGVVPISFANKEGIIHEFWAIDMMFQYFDNAEDHKKFWSEGSFVGNEKLKDCMEKYKYLYDQEYLDPAGNTLDYASNYFSKFSSGNVASIWFINSMYVSTIKEGEIEDSNVGYGLVPFMGDGELKDNMATLGYCLAISNWTEYPEESAKAIEYFVSEKWQSALVDYGVVPAFSGIDIEETGDLTPNMEFIMQESSGEFTEMGYALLVGTQYDEFIRSGTPYMQGDITFEEFAATLEAASVLE